MAQVINSFNSSAKHVNLLKKHAEQTGCAAGKLIGLCTTRYIERHALLARFWNVLPTIVCAVHERQSWADRTASTKAHTLLCCLEKSDTHVSLACLNAIASIMKPLAQALQKKGEDLVRALHLVDDTTIGADSTGATGNFAPVLTQEPGQTSVSYTHLTLPTKRIV